METARASGSLRKAISVLHSFSPNKLEFSVNEMCQNTKIPRATAYRIIKTLVEGRFVERNENTGRYRVGVELFVLGSLYLHTLDIFKAAEPVIKSLTDLTDEAFHIGILEEGNMVLLMREESNQPIKVALPLGTIRPAYASGMGKALLSELTDEEIDILYPEEELRQITKYTIATRTDLKSDLKKIKKSGVSIDAWGANEGATGIASVIRDASGKAVAAVGVAIPDSRLDSTKRDRFALIVKSGANLISYLLGFKDNHNLVHSFEEIRFQWEQK